MTDEQLEECRALVNKADELRSQIKRLTRDLEMFAPVPPEVGAEVGVDICLRNFVVCFRSAEFFDLSREAREVFYKLLLEKRDEVDKEYQELKLHKLLDSTAEEQGEK